MNKSYLSLLCCGVTALAAAALFFLPSVFYDRYARRKETLTYNILRVL